MNDIQIYDMYDIWYQPPWIIRYFYHSLFFIGFIILVVFGYYWYKKRVANRKKCWHRALEQLATLNVKDHKAFYFSLTSILKNYLIERYSVDVNSKTDWEMVKYLEDNKYGHIKDLKKIFNETTAVKFSHQDVDDSVLREHLCLSINVVKNSVPKEG